ncbi:hypothetical protein Rsub_01436 [Raphidocelis subcapitata]|uniref:Uncharacterized protein n=1 Tax=Raphidocelis subcapitata TaxID=307507 RepID=A0A2V0NVG9_9CHLO|nr:hypothetical protein Rsub_01436 [Raphidocelis subcapitata]|eukprot:GBF88937.1 hypothetical protein Rsub_01436 [Raphidocelis subcapitata]
MRRVLAAGAAAAAAEAPATPRAHANLAAALKSLFASVRRPASARAASATRSGTVKAASLPGEPAGKSPAPAARPAGGRPAHLLPPPANATAAARGTNATAKPTVTPVLTTPAGAVALMPGLRSIRPNATAQMSALFDMLQTPEEVVRNSELVTVPTPLQATLARLAASAMAGAKVVLPEEVQGQLLDYLRRAGSGTHDILVPAGSTGMVFSPAVQALIKGGGPAGA